MIKKIKKIKPTAQEIQDEIFRNMPADKKIDLVSEFSMRILKLIKQGLCKIEYEKPKPIDMKYLRKWLKRNDEIRYNLLVKLSEG